VRGTLAALACATTLCGTAALQAPASGSGSPDLLAVVRAAEPDGELAVVAALEAAMEAVPEAERDGWAALDVWRDLLGTRLTFAGDAAGALRMDCAAYASNRGRRSEPALDGFTPKDAVQAIVELAAGREVVMLNEEHRRSQQRAFAHELLAPLAAAGFTHLALETLITDPAALAALAERGHPLVGDGFYTRDPVLGDLVRRALELGLVVTGYEADSARRPKELAGDPLASTNWRENEQARNLLAVLDAQPDARVVVWCGRHHLSELRAEPGEESWTPMAGIFAELSGIDPLSVDLMVLNEADVPERERDVYRAAVEGGLVEEPTVFLDADGAPYSAFSHIDVTAFLPRSRYAAGRPQWMRMGGLRRELELEPEDENVAPSPGRPLLFEARVAGEPAAAVPLDRALWRSDEPPALLLRPGLAYAVRIVAPPNEVVWEGSVDWTAGKGGEERGGDGK